MKVLTRNLAKTSTISSLNENISYPASNLADRFLDRPFVSTSTGDTVTFDCGEDSDIDGIYIASCTAAFVDIEITKENGAVVYTASINVKSKMESLYFTSVEARYIAITSSLTDGIAAWVLGDNAVESLARIESGVYGEYPSATDLFSRNQLDDTPVITYPDNPAGTTYLQDAWADVNGWNALSTMAVSVSGGELLCTKSAPSTYISKTLSVLTGQILMIRVRLVSGALTDYTFKSATSGVAVNVTLPSDGSWVTLAVKATTNVTSPVFYVGTYTSTEYYTIAFDYAYIGDGSYTWTIGDASGNGNALVPHGGLTQVPGVSGKAIQFDGVTGYLSGVLSGFADKITVSFWEYFEAFSATAKYLFSSLTTTIAAGQIGVVINYTSTPGRLRVFYCGDTSVRLSGYYQLPSAGLHLITVSMDTAISTDGALTVCVDGSQVPLTYDLTTALRPPIANNAYYIHQFGGGISFSDGWIDELHIYKRILSSNETLGIYSQDVPRYLTTTAVIPPAGFVLNIINKRYTIYGTAGYAYVYDATVTSKLKIKGVGFGKSFDLGERSYQSELPSINDTIMTTSATGQTLANSAPTRLIRDFQIPVIRKEEGITRVNSIRDALTSIGIGIPTYWDLNDDDSDFEVPIYGIIPQVWNISFDRQTYIISIRIMEAR